MVCPQKKLINLGCWGYRHSFPSPQLNIVSLHYGDACLSWPRALCLHSEIEIEASNVFKDIVHMVFILNSIKNRLHQSLGRGGGLMAVVEPEAASRSLCGAGTVNDQNTNNVEDFKLHFRCDWAQSSMWCVCRVCCESASRSFFIRHFLCLHFPPHFQELGGNENEATIT